MRVLGGRGGAARGLRALVAGLGLAALAAGCTPLGLGRGDYWTGTSSGTGEACPPFEFELAIDDGRVTGSATAEFPWGAVLWDVRGQVGPERQVTLTTQTVDPRVASGRLTWTGSYNLVLWELAQAPDSTCPSPRVVKLQRR